MIQDTEDAMSILRLLLIVLVIGAIGLWVTGYLGGLRAGDTLSRPSTSVTSDTVDRARQRGAEIGETAARATTKAEETLSEAALTAKIKAKMALDDAVKARAINVTTHGTSV